MGQLWDGDTACSLKRVVREVLSEELAPEMRCEGGRAGSHARIRSVERGGAFQAEGTARMKALKGQRAGCVRGTVRTPVRLELSKRQGDRGERRGRRWWGGLRAAGNEVDA